MTLYLVILAGILILVSCGQNNSSDSKKEDRDNSEVKSNKFNEEEDDEESNTDLEDEFEKDAQEMGRLICLERRARENDDDEEHDRIEGEKMLLKQKMKKKYKKFIGKDEYEELYEYNEEIGKKICSDY